MNVVMRWKNGRPGQRQLWLLWLLPWLCFGALGEAMHGAACPEMALLRWAGHAKTARPLAAPIHQVAADDEECLACAWNAQAIGKLAPAFILALMLLVCALPFLSLTVIPRRAPIWAWHSRGPPLV